MVTIVISLIEIAQKTLLIFDNFVDGKYLNFMFTRSSSKTCKPIFFVHFAKQVFRILVAKIAFNAMASWT